MSLSHDEMKELSRNVLDMDPRDHWVDHQWTKAMRDNDARWLRMREKILTSAAVFALPIALGFLATALWHEVASRLAALVK